MIDYDFHQACKDGDIAKVKYFLDHPTFRIEYDSIMSLWWAIEAGHLNVVKLLSEDPRINLIAWSNTSLERAVAKECVDIVQFLLAKDIICERLKERPYEIFRSLASFRSIGFL